MPQFFKQFKSCKTGIELTIRYALCWESGILMKLSSASDRSEEPVFETVETGLLGYLQHDIIRSVFSVRLAGEIDRHYSKLLEDAVTLRLTVIQ